MIRDKSQVTQVNNLKIIWINLKLDGSVIVNTCLIPKAAKKGFYDTIWFFGLERVNLGLTGSCTEGLVLQNGKEIVFTHYPNWNEVEKVDVRNLYSCLYINLTWTSVTDFDFNATPNLILAVIHRSGIYNADFTKLVYFEHVSYGRCGNPLDE